MKKNKYMLIYWWGYSKNNEDNRPFIEWIDKEADEHFTEDNGFDIDDIEGINLIPAYKNTLKELIKLFLSVKIIELITNMIIIR